MSEKQASSQPTFNDEFEIVGWGCADGEVCYLCAAQLATLYITLDGVAGMVPACRKCVPAGSCCDHVAEVFERTFTSIMAPRS